MRITYACPACHATTSIDGIESLDSLECAACHAVLALPPDAFAGRGDDAGPPRLQRCLICPSLELFVRKNFPQRLGVAIVVAGILFGTALLDVVLFLFMPNCLSCYRCGARYSGEGVANQHGDPAAGSHQFEAFDLETHEKHRQLVARTKQLHSDPTHP